MTNALSGKGAPAPQTTSEAPRTMTGAEYVARFLKERGIRQVFLLTGGACAFMVDAIGREPGIDYVCFQNEQGAAIAADTVWRIGKTVGATMATSGPGATNLLTGIACSYFDSIPSIHITGQVNSAESGVYLGTRVRQAGFQETNIVDMAKPVTKYAIKVNSVDELKRELTKAYNIAITHRMGPVLIDVPMDVQKADAGDKIEYEPPAASPAPPAVLSRLKAELEILFRESKRPLVLVGAGIGLSGIAADVIAWIARHNLPFASSWNGAAYFNHDSPGYLGTVGVYGLRGANYALQNCDALLVLGNRLDNRQRSGNVKTFVPGAKVHVIDVDEEELKKYARDGYASTRMDLTHLPPVLDGIKPAVSAEWSAYARVLRERYLDKNESTFAREHGTLSPYDVIRRITRLIDPQAVVISDCGGSQCWVHQAFHRTTQTFFTSGGMAPMGYALPAAVGVALTAPDRRVIAYTGDGGLQVNIQEMQTARHYGLDVKVVIMNNQGYGIIKQFQDSYFGGRYEASGRGYGIPDFKGIAAGYGFEYVLAEKLDDITSEFFARRGPAVLDVMFHPNTLIEPRLEMGRPINDQFPYVSDEEFKRLNPFYTEPRMGRRPA